MEACASCIFQCVLLTWCFRLFKHENPCDQIKKKGLLLYGNLYLQWVTSCVRLKDLKLQLLYMFFFASVVYRTCFLLVCHGFDRSFIFPVGVRMWEIGRSFDFVAAGAETSGIVVWIKLVFLKFFVSFWASIYGVYYVLY